MQINCKSSAFFCCTGCFGSNLVPKRPLSQWDFLQDLINRSCGLQETLEIHQFLYVCMEISLLLDGVADLKKKLLVDQLFDAANGEMRNEILPVAKVAQIIESV